MFVMWGDVYVCSLTTWIIVYLPTLLSLGSGPQGIKNIMKHEFFGTIDWGPLGTTLSRACVSTSLCKYIWPVWYICVCCVCYNDCGWGFVWFDVLVWWDILWCGRLNIVTLWHDTGVPQGKNTYYLHLCHRLLVCCHVIFDMLCCIMYDDVVCIQATTKNPYVIIRSMKWSPPLVKETGKIDGSNLNTKSSSRIGKYSGHCTVIMPLLVQWILMVITL